MVALLGGRFCHLLGNHLYLKYGDAKIPVTPFKQVCPQHAVKEQ